MSTDSRRSGGKRPSGGARIAETPSTETRIGEVLKRLREQSGVSLRTLGGRAGVSASFLSQLENGQVSPSIASLERIAAELRVTLADLFEASQTPTAAVVRAHQRPGFTSSWSRARVESLTPAGQPGTIEAVAVRLAAQGASGKRAAAQAADQFVFVLQGAVKLYLGDEELALGTGDSILIPRKTAHRWVNEGPGAAQVLLASARVPR